MVIHSLRSLLACWNAEEPNEQAEEPPTPEYTVVYTDNVMAHLLDSFESLAVAASESMQHQTMAEIVDVFAVMFERLPDTQQRRAEDLVLRVLSALGDHVLTARLDAALFRLVTTLRAADRPAITAKVEAARRELAASIGKLGSRASRVQDSN